MVQQIEYLSEAAYDKLVSELEERKTTRRATITQRIAAARAEGDLKENGGYHAARDEQGKNEARIRELEHRLEHSEVGIPTDIDLNGKLEVTPGMLVTAKLSTSGDKLHKFILGSRDNADDDITAYSPSSPIGGAILGAEAGEKRSYKAPNGAEIVVQIIDVQPYV
jgi:transcription elongation factor GreA